jgi:Ca-activated chloride channel family protein
MRIFAMARTGKSFFFMLMAAVMTFTSCTAVSARLELVKGNVYFSRGKYAEASAAYIEAMKDAGAAPYASYALGNVYLAMGQNEAALDRYAEAENNANMRENRELVYRSRYNSGIARFTGGDFEAAADYFRRALDADGSRVDAKVNFELSLLQLLRKKEDAQVRTTQRGSVSEDERRRKSEILFNFVRQKEADRWKSWDFTVENEDTGPDY